MNYRIETTDPVSGKTLDQLMDLPYVIENTKNDDSLIIYFETEQNRATYLSAPQDHKLAHYP